jgi:hypothetical protein
MSKAPTEAQRKRVIRFVNKYRHKLFLEKWDLNISYMRYNKSGSKAVADISINEEYFDAKICIYPRFWNLYVKDQEFAILHELCHCITEESFDVAANILQGSMTTHEAIRFTNERMTQTIAKILFYRGGK